MINPKLLTESLAKKIALAIMGDICTQEAMSRFKANLITALKETVENKEDKNAEFFEALFKRLDPHEKKFKAMVEDVWRWERATILANIKKMRKEWLRKDAVDQLLFPKVAGVAKLEAGSVSIYLETLTESAETQIERYDFGIAFDVESEQVKDWIKTYIPKFSNSLETVSIEKLRTTLEEGIKAGEGIPELSKRVNETYANWHKYRSEAIARSEVIRASNKGALEAYRQSGIVKKKIWITFHDLRTCAWCADMDGKTVALEKAFIEGDSFTITADGKERTLDISYEEMQAPPLHSMCRCDIGAWMET